MAFFYSIHGLLRLQNVKEDDEESRRDGETKKQKELLIIAKSSIHLWLSKIVGKEQVTQNDSNTNKKYVAMEKDGARACVGSSWFSAGDSGKLNIHIDI